MTFFVELLVNYISKVGNNKILGFYITNLKYNTRKTTIKKKNETPPSF